MPSDRDQRESRRREIISILRSARIVSQAELVQRLRRSGFDVTQSSVSRDLHELGVAKHAGRYRLPAPEQNEGGELAAVAPFLRKFSPAGSNLLVVQTAVGAAQSVALAIDSAGWLEVVGTVAGDDTIFLATLSSRSQKRVLQRLRRALRPGEQR